MLTVAILISRKPIMARSAVRRERLPNDWFTYRVDDGGTVEHDPNDGWRLTHRSLDTDCVETLAAAWRCSRAASGRARPHRHPIM